MSKMTLQTRQGFLQRTPLFQHLDAEEIARVAGICTEKRIERGRAVFHEADPGGSLYVIVAGSIKILITAEDGREHILGILGQGDYFGELSLIDREPRSATAIALDTTQMLTIERADFVRLLRESPGISLHIMEELTQRLRRTDKHVETLAFLKAPGRVAKVLLELVEGEYGASDDVIELPGRMTRQELGDMVGLSRETLTRILMSFQKDGLIKIERSRIQITDPKRLREQLIQP